MPLNAIEVEQLQLAIDVISQFNGMPQFTWVNEMIPKLKQGLYLHKNLQYLSISIPIYI